MDSLSDADFSSSDSSSLFNYSEPLARNAVMNVMYETMEMGKNLARYSGIKYGKT